MTTRNRIRASLSRILGAVLSTAFVLAMPCAAHAALELPALFSDHAVLQRDRPIRLWGRAAPQAKVEIAFDGRTLATHAGQDGRWSAALPAHPAGGPYTLTIRSNDERVALNDVLVGDVWLASGQSNMEFPVAKAAHANEEIAQSTDSAIRHFKVTRAWDYRPAERLAGGTWIPASPRTAGDFSAVAYFFARHLRAEQNVPIGIVDSTWGGSRIEAWMSASALGLEPAALNASMQTQKARDEAELAETRNHLARWPGNRDDSGWAAADLDERDWAPIVVPAVWEDVGYPGMDGVAWYRTHFSLTAEQVRGGVTIGLGRIDDSDSSFVNGVAVGGLSNQWNTPRVYRVAPTALRIGDNSIAVRVTDNGDYGGVRAEPGELYVEYADGQRTPLRSPWKFKAAQVSVSADQGKNKLATMLYNGMIEPLEPYTLRGVIWYQGEDNAFAADAFRYRDEFARLIKSWRRGFGDAQLPFLWVQLANFVAERDTADSSPWAVLRESQSATLALPATGQAVTIDVGDPGDIHPTNKQEVARRLALAARHVAYGETLVFSGPVYRTATFAAGTARVEFELGGSTLAVRGGGDAVHGFELAGADGRFVPAWAKLDGPAVVVTSDAIAAPRAVRYAWRENPADADLVNREGLPASPFRSGAR